eukprot:PhF_6_TR38604/c1_g3_i4/m.57458
MTRVNELLFVFGGLDFDGKELGDFWCYTPVYQQWDVLEPSDSTQYPVPRYGAFMFPLPLPDGTTIPGLDPKLYKTVARVGISGGSDGGEERWEFTIAQNIFNETLFAGRSVPMVSTYPTGVDALEFSRVMHTQIGSGATWIICGGSTDEDFAGYNNAVECHGWNSVTKKNFISVGEMPINVMGAAAVAYKNRMFIIS